MTAPLFASSLEIARFEERVKTRALGKRIHFHTATQSTNDLALDAARAGAAHGSVYIADAQAAGRGRRGRHWDCPPALGLLFSVLLRPASIPLEAAGWIPLVAGLACAEALAAISKPLQSVNVKWPNDIVLPCAESPGWKKLGGILCESALPALSNAIHPTAADRGYAIIGIGINLNQNAAVLPQTGKAEPTSIFIETGKPVDRTEVLKSILERLETHLDALSDPETRDSIQSRIETRMRAWLPPSTRITFRTPPLDAQNAHEHFGTFAGLDSFGRIRILNQNVETAYADIEITRAQ